MYESIWLNVVYTSSRPGLLLSKTVYLFLICEWNELWNELADKLYLHFVSLTDLQLVYQKNRNILGYIGNCQLFLSDFVRRIVKCKEALIESDGGINWSIIGVNDFRNSIVPQSSSRVRALVHDQILELRLEVRGFSDSGP